MGLTDKYRPKHWREVIGHREVVKSLSSTSDWKSVLLHGVAGCGKTSLARILAMAVNCANEEKPCGKCSNCLTVLQGTGMDYREENVGDARGIDAMREIIDWLRIKPIQLKKKILVLDESHCLTSHSQALLLKVLEEPPAYVIIILCTTNADGLIDTVRQRCSQFPISLVAPIELVNLLIKVVAEEKIELSAEDAGRLIELAEGSPRKLLMELEVIKYGGKKISENTAEEEKYILELFEQIIAGNVLQVRDNVIVAFQKHTPDEILRRLFGYLKEGIKRAKSKDKLLMLYAIIQSLSQSKEFYYVDKEGKTLLTIMGATIVASSFNRSSNNEVGGEL